MTFSVAVSSLLCLQEAERGQFVTMVRAYDPDMSDWGKLNYTILGGNGKQIFTINRQSGMGLTKGLKLVRTLELYLKFSIQY